MGEVVKVVTETRPPRKKAKKTLLGEIIRNRIAYYYLLPSLIVMAIITFYPIAYGVAMSFTNWSYNHQPLFGQDFNLWKMLGQSILSKVHLMAPPAEDVPVQFIAFKNFFKALNVFQDPDFFRVLLRTVVWTILNVFFHVAIGLALALMLNIPKLFGKSVYRVLFILPWAMPNYISMLIFRGLYNGEFGAVNAVLQALHIPPAPWLTSPNFAMAAVIIANVWAGFSFMMIVALGALQSIPQELYEAADVDGATKIQKFRTITAPLLKPSMLPSIILGMIWTFNNFNTIFLITQGGPADPNSRIGSTHIITTFLYSEAFTQGRYGMVSAYSILVLFILLIFNGISMKVTKATEGVY